MRVDACLEWQRVDTIIKADLPVLVFAGGGKVGCYIKYPARGRKPLWAQSAIFP